MKTALLEILTPSNIAVFLTAVGMAAMVWVISEIL